ncbi:MAG TPA: LON peptidase substrate-binding domain-containing protein [Candidatus Limnocylindrales bacterium]
MEIPLFPLHTVLCPGIALPLHIFEPRYRLMIERCVEKSVPFGIVLIREGREVGSGKVAIAGVGTFAEIREATLLPDGRYDLLVVGSGRFTVDEIDLGKEPYLVGEVTALDDEVGDQVAATTLAARTMRRFVAYLQLLQPMEGETAEEIDVRVEIETETDPGADPEAEPELGPMADPIEITTEDIASVAASEDPLAAEAEEPDGPDDDPERAARLEEAARRLVIPEDPTVLSYLLSGIIQVDAVRRQALLEAASTEARLEALDRLIERELWMLRRRLRFFVPDPRYDTVRRN